MHFGILLVIPLWLSPAVSLAQEATPVASQPPYQSRANKSAVWDQVDVTVELRDEGSFHVTERSRVAFSGGPFRTGYREIPLARIEEISSVRAGAVEGDRLRWFRYVAPSDFTASTPNTYTFREIGPNMRIDWSFPETTSQIRTFQIEYDVHGALRIYDDEEPPYQQISWIGVDRALTQTAPVNAASLTFILPQPVDPGETIIQGTSATIPEDHTADGQTWVWTATDLGPGESLEAVLQFPPLVPAEKPVWQDASDLQEQQESDAPAAATPTALATPLPSASPVTTPTGTPPCREVMENDFNGKTRDLLADCTTDRPIFVPEDWVFDGGGHSIFAVDPDDGRLTGGVVMVTGASGTVRHVTIDGVGLTAECVVDRGQTALTGVVFRGASGEVSGVTVRNLARSLPAAATSPTVPAESVRESCGAGIAVLGRDANVVVNENVIENVGYVGVRVEIGQASISRNTIDRAADTGILASLGAHVRITPGNKIRNANVGIQLEGESTGGRVAGNTIERITLMGVAIIGGAQASVADNSIADTAVNGIAIEGLTSEATVQNNQLDEPGEVGIKALGRRAEIRDNTVSGGTFSIGVGGGGTAQVVGNTVNHPQNTGIYVLHEGTTATIDGNTVADAASDGIWVEQAARATITGNTVTDAKSNGITAVAGAAVTISGENIVHGGERGIALGDAGTIGTVTGNRVEGASVVGITISTGATAPDVSGNTVVAAQFGITTLGAGTSATVTDNSVTELEATGYTVESGATAELHRNHVTRARVGIYVDGLGSSGELSENRIEQTTTAGIVLATGSQTTATSNTITVPGIDGIRITGVGTTATIRDTSVTGAAETGIEVGNGALATIEDGNRVSGGKWGISVTDAGTTATVHGNDVSGVTNQGISVLYGARATVSNNAITGGDTGVLVRERGSALVEGNRIREVVSTGITLEHALAAAESTSEATGGGIAIVSLDILFDPKTVTIPANTDVTVVLPNQGAVPHNFSVDELGISVDIAPGATEEIVIDAPAGEYEFYCDVPGHKQAGMVGTLTVSADAATPVATPLVGHEAATPAAAAEPDEAIRRNTITGGQFGIVVKGAGSVVPVEENIVRSVEKTGISIENEASADLQRNTVSGTTVGINIARTDTMATLTGNRVENTAERGIVVQLGANAVLRRNVVSAAGTSGVAVGGEGTTATLEGNIVMNAAESGIVIEQVATATIDKANYVTGGQWGISILSSGTSAEVRGNRVRNVTNQGISVLYGAQAMVDGNTVEGGDSGIYVRYPNSQAIITGNFVSAEDQGIYVWEGATAERITDNTVTGGRHGIVAERLGTRARIEGNQIRETSLEGIEVAVGASAEVINNTITQIGSPSGGWGILVTGPRTEATVHANTIRDISGIGIQFGYEAEGSVTANRLTQVADTGIRIINEGTTATVTGNTVRGARLGIEGEASKITITDNTVADSRLFGIQLGPEAVVEVTGNTITGPEEPDPDQVGPHGIRVLAGVIGTITGNEVANHASPGPDKTACGIVIDAGASDVLVFENLFPHPGNEVDMCDERPRLPLATPVLASTSAPPVGSSAPASTPVPAATPGAAGS